MAAVKLSPLRPRPLEPVIAPGYTAANGPIEPESRVPLARHRERTMHGAGGALVAGGGWPAPIRRTAGFTVMPHSPVVVPVNVVTGVPTQPGNARRKRSR